MAITNGHSPPPPPPPPEKLATQGAQDDEIQSRETGNIGYTRRRNTIQRNWQHRVHKTKKNNTEKLEA